jgi:transposase-like protein
MVGALHALSNPAPAFNRLCGLGLESPLVPVEPTSLPPPGARHLQTREVEAILRAYEAGEPVVQIARRFGIHRSTFYVRLERAGVHLRPREALTPAKVREAAELYNRGSSFAQVGRMLGVHAQTVRNHLAKAGVTTGSTVDGSDHPPESGAAP